MKEIEEIIKYSTSGFWVFIGCYSLITIVLYYIFRIFNRILRVITTSINGWPPEHLDSDGDFKSKEDGN